ncbi:D-alanine--D-alanine ligase [Marinomonas colpomeniae]|uniref:D-alanine--D-alanine ligase n=1 Tax=Marinomonas colpomeniae TaxID=2774408 RepID=A0ABR8NTR7_9GAMM|nr:D-alanine--D-alanine ligase [Marinomonas colpomeniae]MBD5769440.1 D-alanine--D-alanine ligase [Marinomonas colpomeniae]
MSLMSGVQLIPPHKINAGMPTLEVDSKRSISRYEFFPAWFFYTPVVIQSLCQGMYYGDFRLPLVVNPSIKLSGMVGESKHEIMSLAGDIAKPWVSPFITRTKNNDSVESQAQAALAVMNENGLFFPLVAKPDLGCRGVGVKLLQDEGQLEQYIRDFPDEARFLLQEKAPYQAEAGVFYVRQPGEAQGEIISITLKYAPSVLGDGLHTLKQLIELSPRAGQLSHLYLPRHTEKLNWIPEKDEEFQLAFAGSHSRGSIFRDGNQYITAELTKKLDAILHDVDGYHYGRLDIKFDNLDDFMKGEKFTILELNGASSEAAHIWDRNTPLKAIFSMLLKQYRLLYAIGAKQKKRGHKPPPLSSLLAAWREEKALTERYPSTD